MGVFANTFNAIANAIKAKDGGGDMTPAQMAGRIAALPSGSSAIWNPPEGWPNLRTILQDDAITGYDHKCAILFNAGKKSYTPPGNCYARYSDSDTITNASHTFDPTKDIVCEDGLRLRYAVIYFNGDSLPIKNLGISMYSYWFCSLEKDYYFLSGGDFMQYDNETMICFEANVKASTSSMNNAFMNCYSLNAIIGKIDLTGVTTANSMFNTASSLMIFPELIGTDSLTSMTTSLYNGGAKSFNNNPFNFPAITSLPMLKNGNMASFPNIVATNLTSAIGTVDQNMYREMYFPTTFCVNKSFAFTGSTQHLNDQYKFTLATFDGNGVLDGGMFHSLPTISTAETVTMNSKVKGWFTSEEQTAIADALTAKGWTLAW